MEFSVTDMVFSIINFLVLLAILNKFMFKPLLKVIDERQDEIGRDLAEAAEANTAAQKIQAEYLAQMEETKAEAKQIMAKATKMGEKAREEMISQAQAEAVQMTEKAREVIRREKEEALHQLRDEVSSLVVLATGKLIDQTIDAKTHEKLIHKFIAEVGDVS